MRKTGKGHLWLEGVWYGIAIAIVLLLLTGCENLFGEDEEEDGTLTVSISGFVNSCTDPNVPYFVVFVLPGGSDPYTTDPIAVAYEENIGSSASGVAEVPGDGGPTGTIWSGRGGDRYDVYPTVYCIDESTDVGEQLDSPDWVYGAKDYSQPLSYKQDGDQSFSTAFGDYE